MIDKTELRDMVKDVYSGVALRPLEQHRFPSGRGFAESIGYPAELLDRLPAVSVDSFTGVSNVSIFAEIPQGAIVLDLGCGAGLDTLIAAGKTGPNGKVYGVDFSPAMIECSRSGAAEAGMENVEYFVSDAEVLPLSDESVDIAIVNGIFNLSPNREQVFAELARVVRKGGRVYAAELILNGVLLSESSCSLDNWFR